MMNNLHHTPVGGSISVTVRLKNKPCVSLLNTGLVSPHKICSACDKFYQNQSRSAQGGSGLEL